MNITITGPVSHRCPFVDEWDHGRFTLTHGGDELIELRELRAYLDGFYDQRMTHEDLTEAFGERYPLATVVTQWQTAGMEVECRVVPSEPIDTAGA